MVWYGMVCLYVCMYVCMFVCMFVCIHSVLRGEDDANERASLSRASQHSCLPVPPTLVLTGLKPHGSSRSFGIVNGRARKISQALAVP